MSATAQNKTKTAAKPKIQSGEEFQSANGKTGSAVENQEEAMETTTEGTKKKRNRKRHNAQTGEPDLPKRFKMNPIDFHKNPLMALNEFKPGLTFTMDSMEGPPHNPKFTVSADVDGRKFVGTGRSKQDAKHAAARAVLASFNELRSYVTMDVSSSGSPDNSTEGSITDSTTPSNRLNKILKTGDSKNPVMLLNELHPGLEYPMVAENLSSPSSRFTVSVTVNGQTYKGSGQGKKQAKAAAAQAALASLYGVTMSLAPDSSCEFDMNLDYLEPLPQVVANKIVEATFAKYFEVTGLLEESQKKWNVLASFCMTDDEAMSHVTVIAISTGTKCISVENVSMNGATLNDSHAEVLVCRNLKDFLYTQLELHLKNQGPRSVLQQLPTGGFRLKNNVKFHLFISTLPCGDARTYSSQENTFPERTVPGLLRTKIGEDESTPVKPHEATQTFKTLQKGQRLLTMSCSDKLAIRNILGVQGALLSHFMEPIYLEGLVLGSEFNIGHMYKAMGGRAKSFLTNLPEPFNLNIPKMCTAKNVETNRVSKTPNHNVHWRIDKPVEIVNAATGKQDNTQISRLVRREFYRRFCNLKDKLRLLPKQTERSASMYVKAKAQAKDYQDAKLNAIQAFKSAGLGLWVKKPEELGQFEYRF